MTDTKKDYISKSEYYMGFAILSALRSKDPNFKVGACIVNKKGRIVGAGYNGMPDNHGNKSNNDEKFTWKKDYKQLYVVHAESNAIRNSYGCDLSDCTIYTTLHPCNECAKLIAQHELKEVVYLSNSKKHKPEYEASRKIMSECNIPCRPMNAPENLPESIELNFKEFAKK